MDKLCYVAIPQGWESPKGVLMRTALHNGYSTVAAMCASLEVPCSDDGLELLSEQSLILNKLAVAAPEIAYTLLANSYTVKKPNAAVWFIDDVMLDRWQFSKKFRYCPECLRNQLITVFQDLEYLSVCPIHQTEIVTRCQDCQTHEHWSKANLFFCTCGSDRRSTESHIGTLIGENYLETYGPKTAIPTLTHMIPVAQICEEVWHSRIPHDEERCCLFMDDLRNHASRMIAAQLSKYPGFTRSMHLSPWLSTHPQLLTLAEKSFKEPNNFNDKCITGSCCADVYLTRSEITSSLDNWKDSLEKHKFIKDNFRASHTHSSEYYYRSHEPICKLIRFANNLSLHLKKEDTLKLCYLTTLEAGKLLQCSSGTILQLAELGYLIKLNKQNSKTPGSGHHTLITVRSVENFNKNFILVGRISNSLKTTPIQTVRLLNQLGVSSNHNQLGPHVYEQYNVHTAWKKLEEALKAPPSLYPIKFPPTQCIHNILKICSTHKATTEEITPIHCRLTEESATENNECCYTTNQTAKFLNISSRLLYYRFVLTGLINPETVDNTTYYSLAHIQKISHHLQRHMSIEQVSRALKCGNFKVISLINASKLQPSCTLAFSNGDIQLLYQKDDIDKLTNGKHTKTRKKKVKRRHKLRKRAQPAN